VTLAVSQLSGIPDICQVVVGDVKSPPYPPNTDNTVYLSYQDQLKLGYDTVNVLPPNCFARGAIGYIFAVRHGAEYIYDFDDDNPFIDVSQGGEILRHPPKVPGTLYAAKGISVNPYPYFLGDDPHLHIWPRGFPLQLVKGSYPVYRSDPVDKVAVFQFLQNLNPDLDTIFRLTHQIPKQWDPNKKDCVGIDPRGFAPFNAQSTLFAKDAFFGLILPMSVNGRVSDIWRSFIIERILRVEDAGKIVFCPAIVEHHRNPHSLIRDFNAELPLYQQTFALLKFLDEEISPIKGQPLESLREIYISLAERGILEETDVAFVEAWVNDFKNAMASR
jgi:hypothetical protein